MSQNRKHFERRYRLSCNAPPSAKTFKKEFKYTQTETEDESDSKKDHISTMKELLNGFDRKLASLENEIKNLNVKLKKIEIFEARESKHIVKHCYMKGVYQEENTLLNATGRLIWNIDHFNAKSTAALNGDIVYDSQPFSTKNYGYKFQVSAFLNGIGIWKNNDVLFSINLCPTPWDVLLEWPCRINVKVTIVDQIYNRSEAKDECKYFKNVCLTRDKNSFKMFLPKKQLLENNYIFNDSLLVEVIIKEEEN